MAKQVVCYDFILNQPRIITITSLSVECDYSQLTGYEPNRTKEPKAHEQLELLSKDLPWANSR